MKMPENETNFEDLIMRRTVNLTNFVNDTKKSLKAIFPKLVIEDYIYNSDGSAEIITPSDPNYLSSLKACEFMRRKFIQNFLTDNIEIYISAHPKPHSSQICVVFNLNDLGVRVYEEGINLSKKQKETLYDTLKPYTIKKSGFKGPDNRIGGRGAK